MNDLLIRRKEISTQISTIFSGFSGKTRRSMFAALPERIESNDPLIARYYELKDELEDVEIQLHKIKHPEYY